MATEWTKFPDIVIISSRDLLMAIIRYQALVRYYRYRDGRHFLRQVHRN